MAEEPTNNPTPPPIPNPSTSAAPIVPEKALQTDLRRARRDKRKQQEETEEDEEEETAPQGDSADEETEDESSDNSNAGPQAAEAGKAIAQELMKKKLDTIKKKLIMKVAGVVAPYCFKGCLILIAIILLAALILYLKDQAANAPDWAKPITSALTGMDL